MFAQPLLPQHFFTLHTISYFLPSQKRITPVAAPKRRHGDPGRPHPDPVPRNIQHEDVSTGSSVISFHLPKGSNSQRRCESTLIRMISAGDLSSHQFHSGSADRSVTFPDSRLVSPCSGIPTEACPLCWNTGPDRFQTSPAQVSRSVHTADKNPGKHKRTFSLGSVLHTQTQEAAQLQSYLLFFQTARLQLSL